MQRGASILSTFGAAALREAFHTLRQHRGRAFLTLFGIVWGTAAVIFLGGWGDGVRVMMERGFFKTGRNMGSAWAGRIGEDRDHVPSLLAECHQVPERPRGHLNTVDGPFRYDVGQVAGRRSARRPQIKHPRVLREREGSAAEFEIGSELAPAGYPLPVLLFTLRVEPLPVDPRGRNHVLGE